MRKNDLKKSYFEITDLNHSKFINYLPKKKNLILDFGCGNGSFDSKINSKKIKKIFMYDKNKKLKFYIKNKYIKNPKVEWIDNLNRTFNIVLINSTIQYLTIKQYKALMLFFFRKKVELIIIADIPKYPFYIEAFFCFFIDIKKIFKSVKYLFQKNYNFYYYKKKNDFFLDNSNYKFESSKNFNKDKILRYSIIYKKIRKNL